MLHPQNNTLEYSNGIAPPDGFELKYAIGTTYSLDLEALLLIPIAMIYASHIEKVNGDLTYETISALSDVSKKIDIYSQKGCIQNPNVNNKLYAFWDDSIHEIVMESYAQSFHPKVWVMQFENKKKEQCYKLFVSSKNLTQTGDWDIAYCTQGFVKKDKQENHQPIIDFVNFVNKKGSPKMPIDFLQNLAFVDFELPDNWLSQKFCPIGIPNYYNPLEKRKSDELLVISPFLDKTTIKKFQANTSELILCSTRNALDGIEATKLTTKNYEFNTVIESIGNDENMFDEVDERLLCPSLHAKVFIGKKGDRIFWNFGSANATSPALEARNVEFNIEFETKIAEFAPKQILKQLIPNNRKDEKGEVKLFDNYNPSIIISQSEEELLNDDIRKLIYNICNYQLNGSLQKSSNQIDYDLLIDLDTSHFFTNQFKIKIKPLSCYQENAQTILSNQNQYHFYNISVLNLSKFIIWEIHYKGECIKSFLTKMEIDLPIEERRAKILKSLFDSKEKLFKYISFLITNDDNETINQPIKGEVSGKDANNKNAFDINGLPIYEKLLIASSRMPQKLDAIAQIIKSITDDTEDESNELISKEFLTFWSQFEIYKNNLNGANS